MYTERDKEQILANMLEVTRDDVRKEQGEPAYDLLAAPAEEIETLQLVLEAVSENGFLDTAQMEYIDLRAAEFGEYRKPAVQAKGWLLIADKEGREINIDTIVSAERDGEQITLQVVEYAVVPEGGEVTVQAISVAPGAEGNISAYSDMSCIELPEAFITNPIQFIGGVEKESDDEFKERVLLKVRKPITSGNIYHYELWARQVSGISQARVTPLWDGPGTVKVTVINSDGRAPTAEQVQAVTDYINQPDKKPIGATVTVVAITEVPVNITAELVLEEGLIASDVQEAVENSIAEYLAEANLNVRHSQVARAILRVDGVKDYTDVLIGTGAELGDTNITVSADDVAVVGEVLLS